uniref:Zinc knuckle CX2CX3GHX4C domain-containing protein n=1 Tax=Proboscia inermis TaxID=420281 RepID=A0A7S0GB86_9STRA|mmetsp:Transcript_20503/g.20780  ORF Transcript_20503/g.20780 Transcript_20503/m.20780 type:complete len:183 (+) Transcript_20503:62-610(+)|eukprot:CAMPEP_0194383542 /NCGR_PEP_ID=MMETSP0174-20130528/67891_1 /TAXON_ID=216777 /ORGANISM="Proboscia alata, Strain PI-D3" /LENGTH=182 /DNA_ID=CAMNT_0039169843 /DNA_START=15 /DNA_END=563 /DNA_ORIENTATION=+
MATPENDTREQEVKLVNEKDQCEEEIIPTADKTDKIKRSNGNVSTKAPPHGYVCAICSIPGHWIQRCPEKKKAKKRKRNTNHIPVAGVDPSQDDIAKAKALQSKMTVLSKNAPKCYCGATSRLKKVTKTQDMWEGGERSRAVGNFFFFCKYKESDKRCKFARFVDELNDSDRGQSSKDTDKN